MKTGESLFFIGRIDKGPVKLYSVYPKREHWRGC
jgi:hypothetical protein